MRHVTWRGFAALLGAFVVGVAATSCASPVVETAPPTTAPPVTTTAPTPTPEPTVSEPVTVADGSCEALVDAAALPEELGAESPRVVTAVDSRTLGALSCRWDGTWLLFVDAFPVEAVASDIVQMYEGTVCESIGYDGYGCRLARSSGPTWALITLAAGEQTWGQDVPESVLEEVADVIATELGSVSPGSPAPANTRGWAFESCGEMAEEWGLAATLGADRVAEGQAVDGSAPDPVRTISVEAGTLEPGCVWSAAGDGAVVGAEVDGRYPALSITAYPGAAWDWDALSEEIVPDGVEVSIAGAAFALIDDRENTAGSGGTADWLTTLIVTDGVNVLHLQSRELSVNAADTAAEVLAALAGAPTP